MQVKSFSGGCDLLALPRPTAAFTSGSHTSVDVQQQVGEGGEDTPEKRFSSSEDDHWTRWLENHLDQSFHTDRLQHLFSQYDGMLVIYTIESL